jgi:hypothetical protein
VTALAVCGSCPPSREWPPGVVWTALPVGVVADLVAICRCGNRWGLGAEVKAVESVPCAYCGDRAGASVDGSGEGHGAFLYYVCHVCADDLGLVPGYGANEGERP